MTTPGYILARLEGNGASRLTEGRAIHAVTFADEAEAERANSDRRVGRALCGATAGITSLGWVSMHGQDPSCPRCAAVLARRVTA